MNAQTSILEARNALALCEALLLEAYITSPQPVAAMIRTELSQLATHRETLSHIQRTAATLPPAEAAAALLRVA